MPDVSTFRKAVIIFLHGLMGWGFCGALVTIGRSFLSMETTLIVHAIGAPVGFALLSLHYQRRFAFTGPLQTAVLFLGIVVALDLLLVAPVFEKSFVMFASLLGTWIPFGLIFLATYLTSLAAGSTSLGKPRDTRHN